MLFKDFGPRVLYCVLYVILLYPSFSRVCALAIIMVYLVCLCQDGTWKFSLFCLLTEKKTRSINALFRPIIKTFIGGSRENWETPTCLTVFHFIFLFLKRYWFYLSFFKSMGSLFLRCYKRSFFFILSFFSKRNWHKIVINHSTILIRNFYIYCHREIFVSDRCTNDLNISISHR